MDDKKILSNHLVNAVINNNVQRVGSLLNRGADPNSILDKACVTPLHHAAQNNALEVIPLLIEAGALLEAQTEPEGYTATEIAFSHGNDRIAQALIAYINEYDSQRH
jgi:ankyrin repeat protein